MPQFEQEIRFYQGHELAQVDLSHGVVDETHDEGLGKRSTVVPLRLPLDHHLASDITKCEQNKGSDHFGLDWVLEGHLVEVGLPCSKNNSGHF